MKTLTLFVLLLVTASLFLSATGCSQSKPPEPLPADGAPTEFAKAFAKAKPEAKALASDAVAAMQAKRYPEASALFLQLSQTPDLSAPEREFVTRAMLGVNRQLQEAQAQGDAQATEHLRRLQQSK
jgi:hypothetical protein